MTDYNPNAQPTDVLVIGGGPAGMMAAIAAADRGARVLLLERNEKLGKKLYITGKGRCNVTNACTQDEFIANTLHNGRFLYSAYSAFDRFAVMDFFEQRGVPLKTERGNRVFPVSDHASDITRALEKELQRLHVEVRLHSRVANLLQEEGRITGVKLESGTERKARAVIVATGGMSYPLTGSTGDGYALAKTMGHSIKPVSPSLTSLETKEDWCARLQGLSLKNVRLTVEKKNKKLYSEIGEMLFTHYGVSGPLVLTATAYLSGKPLEDACLKIDLKPGLTNQQLQDRVLRDLQKYSNRSIGNSLFELLPKSMADLLLDLAEIPPETLCNQLSRERRNRFITLLKELPVKPRSLRPMDEAVITRGGVTCSEIDPSTMASRKMQGLFFAGEVMDVDALTGGFNLQVAFSSGYAAGKSAAAYTQE